MLDLELLYRETLRRCAPERLVGRVLRPDMPGDVVAIGKCAGPLIDGFASVVPMRSGFAIVPRGYPEPHSDVALQHGGHPHMNEESFAAGAALLRYVDAHEEITFLISGGGSACVEAPLDPFFTREDLAAVNRRLVSAGIPIAEMNTVRKHLSAIKGGRLAARVRSRSVTLLYSDVSTGDLASVASGPTLPDSTTREAAAAILERIPECDRIVTALRDERLPETVREIGNTQWHLVADNGTLVDTAAELAESMGFTVARWPHQVESDVTVAARELANRARTLGDGEILVGGGEPTVVVRGPGKGGRCLELAARFALELAAAETRLVALFGSSDGVDGNSGVAGGVVMLPAAADPGSLLEDLASSDSLRAAGRVGRAIIISPTGNNLRDLYLVARA